MEATTAAFDFEPVLDRLTEQIYSLLAKLPMLAVALLVVWLAWVLGSWLSRRRLINRVSHANPFLRELTRTTVRWVALVIGVVIALEILNATALAGAVLGTAGVLGVALGFAFKDILENYLAGILLSLRQPFAPRDHVVIDGNEGIVVSLTSRATTLMTLDGNHLRLPNALVFRGVMLNYTRNPSRRFHFDVGIGVEEDLVAAQAIGVAELGCIDGVLATPTSFAIINELGDSNVQVRFFGWVDQRNHNFGKVKSEAIRRVKLALEAAEMDMPEPIYRVQLKEPAPRPSGVESSRKRDARAAAEPRSEAVLDTRATAELEAQIEDEKRQNPNPGTDLLNPNAPRE